MKKLTAFLLLSFLLACVPTQEKKIKNSNNTYAKGFSITAHQGFKKVVVFDKFGKKEQEFLLVPKAATKPVDTSLPILHTPLETIVLTSSSHVPYLELLEEENSLVGFPNTDFISSPKTRKRIDLNQIKELGTSENLNTEILLSLKPDLLMGFAVGKINKSLELVQKNGIPVFLNNDWQEETPLGRAEWLRLFGALFQKEAMADRIFNEIEREYLRVQAIAKNAEKTPTVLSGSIYQDVWYLPAGQSFMATYFKDANTDYLWSDTKGTGSLSLNFENVLEKAQDAELWIGCSLHEYKMQLLEENKHYQKFNPYQQGSIYTYGKLRGEQGGLFFFESGPVQPHIVLKDIIKIAHPELLPNYAPHFFKELE
jgi:iron complex transport system substrate-binding protein